MSQLKRDVLIRIVPQTDLGRSVAWFLVDGHARGLSPHTIDFYASELRCLRAHLEKRGIWSVQDTAPTSCGVARHKPTRTWSRLTPRQDPSTIRYSVRPADTSGTTSHSCPS
jgi:hypothetical protein